MFMPRRFATSLTTLLALTFLTGLISVASAQTNLAEAQSASLGITVQGDLARFTTRVAARQIRIEVYDANNELIFDSGVVVGKAVQWNLLDQQGRPVPDGVYNVVLTTINGTKTRTGIGQLRVAREHSLACATAALSQESSKHGPVSDSPAAIPAQESSAASPTARTDDVELPSASAAKSVVNAGGKETRAASKPILNTKSVGKTEKEKTDQGPASSQPAPDIESLTNRKAESDDNHPQQSGSEDQPQP